MIAPLAQTLGLKLQGSKVAKSLTESAKQLRCDNEILITGGQKLALAVAVSINDALQIVQCYR